VPFAWRIVRWAEFQDPAAPRDPEGHPELVLLPALRLPGDPPALPGTPSLPDLVASREDMAARGLFFELLRLAACGAGCRDGRLMDAARSPLTVAGIALETGMPTGAVRRALRLLAHAGSIERVSLPPQEPAGAACEPVLAMIGAGAD
jgi:hypothetical protein